MSSTRPKYLGVGTSQKSLVVFLSLNVGGVNRPMEVRVPWRDLTEDEVLYDIHSAVASRLRATWESEAPPWDVDLPLPGIG